MTKAATGARCAVTTTPTTLHGGRRARAPTAVLGTASARLWLTPVADESYYRRSLAFVRHVRGRRDPIYGDAKAAMHASAVHTDGPPPVGAVIWFAFEPWGDVGIAIGERRMLGVSHGRPVVCDIGAWPFPYVGWSHKIGPEDNDDPVPQPTGPGVQGRGREGDA